MIELDVQNPYEFESIPENNEIQNWVKAAIQGKTKHRFSVVVRFVNEEEGRTLNKAYRQKDYATNVLSFPFEEPQFSSEITELDEALSQHLEYQHLGDIILSLQVIKKEANQQGKSLKDHLAHLIVHGVLHLQGYDHIENDEAILMESLEIKILEELGFDNPYQETV